jgi:MFS transporter, ACDE family, multidrug resistance protein
MTAAAVLLGVGVLTATRPHLAGIDAPEDELEEATEEAAAITIGNDT